MIYKRGKVYWYKFMWNGAMIRESTKQGNDKVARTMESAHRTSLAKGLVGIREKKAAPTLREFCDKRFEPWAKARFETSSPNNWYWFRSGIRRLTAFDGIAKLPLDAITNEKAAGYAASEQVRMHQRGEGAKQGLAVSSINASLRVLRRILNVAVEWGVIETAPRIQLLTGEMRRERVITQEEEKLYLSFAPSLLFDLATVLADTGMRPDESYRLRWEHISWDSGRFGALRVTHGKTPAAKRVLPFTMRVRSVLEMRWEAAERPHEGWVFPAPTKSGHIDQGSTRKQHLGVFKSANEDETGQPLEKPRLRSFVLYSLRHTFLTRLGESGCDAWTLARIAGHSSIAISARYVHPSEDAVLNAISRLAIPAGGHKNGHTAERRFLQTGENSREVSQNKGEVWCARRDSNSRPNAPEAFALSN
jgi:integrase